LTESLPDAFGCRMSCFGAKNSQKYDIFHQKWPKIIKNGPKMA